MRVWLGVALCAFGLSAVSLAAQPYSFSRAQMGTRVAITVHAGDRQHAQAGADSAFARIEELNGRLSDYRHDSELSLLSASAGSGLPVAVSADLWAVLLAAQRMAQATGGSFDPTVGPVTRLWRWAFRRRRLPPPADLEAARNRVGFRLMVLDSAAQTVSLQRHGMRLDLGGIAKGYAADEALKVLQAQGLPMAVVDAGGDIAVGAAGPDSAGWTVAVGEIGSARLAGCGIAVSGFSYRYIEHAGVRYSHIVDPRTGLGLTHSRTVAVIAPTAMAADALASAASVMTSGVLQHYGAQAGARICRLNQERAAEDVRRCIKACREAETAIMVW